MSAISFNNFSKAATESVDGPVNNILWQFLPASRDSPTQSFQGYRPNTATPNFVF